jgi:hypothetical protein
MTRRISLIFFCLMATATFAASSHSWDRYLNSRFGTQAEYPADLFMNPVTSDNEDGSTWKTTDGATLKIYGFLNALEQTPVSYEAFLRKNSPKRYAGASYRVSKKDLLILSGVTDKTIFYERYAFGDPSGAIHAMTVEYPITARATFDPVVGRISASLGWAK